MSDLNLSTSPTPPINISPAKETLDDISAELDAQAQADAEQEASAQPETTAQDSDADAEAQAQREAEQAERARQAEAQMQAAQLMANHLGTMIGETYANLTDLVFVPRGAPQTQDGTKQAVGKAAITVIGQYDMVNLSPRMEAWVGLAMVVMMDVGARAAIIKRNDDASAETSYTVKEGAPDAEKA